MALMWGKWTHVSHASHRGAEKGCVKQAWCVKSRSRSSKDKGLKGACPAQLRGFHSFHSEGV